MRTRSRRLRALLAGGLVLGVGASLTFAAWTDQEAATSTITAGTFAIEARTDLGAFVDSPRTPVVQLPLAATGLYPAQKRAAWIQIRNKGTVPGTVSLSAVTVTGADGTSAPTGASAALQNALKVGVAVSTTTDPSAAPSCTTSTPTTAVATGVQNIPLPTATGALQAGGTNIVTFCVVLELPVQADNASQGGDVRPTWTFTATTPTA
ncbi:MULTISPECIES: SipW-dependent-type signal peptide-containing protein [Microbacterium]|uniref:SipW-dependent-type signal peptide-containing protein n=1 Tax=Microbacterium TaxID=33882 RepID=UPI00300FEA6E